MVCFGLFALPNKSETEAVAGCPRGWIHLTCAGWVLRTSVPDGVVPLVPLCAVLHGVGSSAQRCNKFKKN